VKCYFASMHEKACYIVFWEKNATNHLRISGDMRSMKDVLERVSVNKIYVGFSLFLGYICRQWNSKQTIFKP